MRMYRLVAIFWLGIFSVPLTSAYAMFPNEIEKIPEISLNGVWEYTLSMDSPKSATSYIQKDSSSSYLWKEIQIPGHRQLLREETPGTGYTTEYYRKNFRLPPEWQARKIVLEFGGVLSPYRVWVDGKYVGENKLYLSSGEFDITNLLGSDQEHGLVVQVQSTLAGRSPALTGIFRDVSLFALPTFSLSDLSVISEVDSQGASAKLQIAIALKEIQSVSEWSDISVSLDVVDPQGKSAAQTTITWFEEQNRDSQDRERVGTAILPISSPHYWTAETPILYRLVVEIKKKDQTLHRISQSVGLRHIQIAGGSVELNGVPIHLRGIVYRESHPQGGFALRESHWMEDLQHMKNANVNTIRIAAHPPHPRFLHLCDELGFYVIVDIPAIPGINEFSEWMQWTRSLIQQSRNHACILAWNLNEETREREDLIREELDRKVNFVKKLDASHPVMMIGFTHSSLPPSVDILAPINPSIDDLQTLSRQKRPVIVAASPSEQGEAAEGLAVLRNAMIPFRTLVGGILWQLVDEVWERSNGEGNRTQNGILNADRTPKPNFWQVRGMYSPIHIDGREKSIKPGKQSIEVPIVNDFDFTNLRDFTGQWFLLRDGKSIESHSFLIDLKPHQKLEFAAVIDIPEDLPDHDYTLQYQFTDTKNERRINEQAIRLRPATWSKDFLMRLRDLEWDEGWNVTGQPLRAQIEHRNYSFIIQLATPGWFMRTQEHNIRLITQGPTLRVDRIDSATDISHASSTTLPSSPRTFWIDSKEMKKIENNVEFHTHLIETGQPATEPPTEAQIDILSSPFGYSDIRFTIKPGISDSVHQLGLSFCVPSTMRDIVWLGNGPAPTYPGQSTSCSWGFYRFHPIDTMQSGIRDQVCLVGMRDDKGYGLGLMLLDGDVAIEPQENGTWITVFSARSGVEEGARLHALTLEQLQGKTWASFRIVPLIRGRYPHVFESLWQGR